MSDNQVIPEAATLGPARKWLYVHAFNLVSRLAPADVRAVHNEVFKRGFKAYNDARMTTVELREDLRND